MPNPNSKFKPLHVRFRATWKREMTEEMVHE